MMCQFLQATKIELVLHVSGQKVINKNVYLRMDS